MTIEWKDWANSFNSFKGLTYFEHYKQINEWRLHRRKFPPPPIEISLDLIHTCQLSCHWCNASRYLTQNNLENRRIEDKHLINLIKFFAKWQEKNYKIRGVCFGGGGESTLHTKLKDALLLSYALGLENSIATNGINFDDELIRVAVKTCRWIGISVDSATSETYQINRKANYFNKVIENIEQLCQTVKYFNVNCDIAYKFLIFDYNQHEIYNACKLAKALGVKDFHARPCNWSHQGMLEKRTINPYNIDLIQEQFKKCHELGDENFRVFTVVHKYNPDFTPKRQFNQCYASPICIQICADNFVYLCPDSRNLEFYKLGTHYSKPENILKFWGSKKHYDLIFKEGCKNCKSRCTFSPYNEQMQRLLIETNDPMCLSFV